MQLAAFHRGFRGILRAHIRRYLLDPTAGIETCLTVGHDSVMHIPGQWSSDGRTLLFAANRDHPAHFGLYRLALDGPAAELLWQSDEPGFLVGRLVRFRTFEPVGPMECRH